MTDITKLFAGILKSHSAHVDRHPYTRGDTRDEFLKEAYRINANICSVHLYLCSIRQSYLSTSAPPHRNRLAVSRTDTSTSDRSVSHQHQISKDRRYFTDAQRDQIDAESKATLRDLNAGITQLEQTEQLRQNTEAKLANKKKLRHGFGVLGRWAAGDGEETPKSPEETLEAAQQETIQVHRQSVIWYLRKKLGEAAEVQGSMMQTRVDREIEKSKSVLYNTKGIGSASSGIARTVDLTDKSNLNENIRYVRGSGVYQSGGATSETAEKKIEQTLSPEQLQQFAKENSDMLKHYEDTLDKVRTAERSMIEISELQTTLAANLDTQSAMIDDLVLQSLETRDDIAGGNKELKRAAERKGPARWVFRASCGLCVFLVLWDFFI